MSSVVLRAAVRAMTPVMLLFSVFMLLRGHHEPGGGFVGGLIAAGALALRELAGRPPAVPVPTWLLGAGLILAAASGLVAPLMGLPVLKAVWFQVLGVHLGTPLLFDVGVYLVVVGFILSFTSALAALNAPEDP